MKKEKQSKHEEERKILNKQKLRYVFAVVIAIIVLAVVALVMSGDSGRSTGIKTARSTNFSASSLDPELKEENVRLAKIEIENATLKHRLGDFERKVTEIEEERKLLSRENQALSQKLDSSLSAFEQRIEKEKAEIAPVISSTQSEAPVIQTWGDVDTADMSHVSAEIPAGTIVKCVLVSAADCSVAIQKPTGPSMVLLRPLDNGHLPRNVAVPLKGSVVIGNAVGDLSSERVYVRGERMTLVERSGGFVETEISAFVSGEDGKEGMRGIVVDRSGSIIARAAFSSFLQGLGQGFQSALNNQTIEKLSKVGNSSVILDTDTYRNSGLQAAGTAMNKLSDYYIKRAEQLQPSIQIAAGRIVDLIFTKSVKIGEGNLRNKIEHARKSKR